MTQSTMKKIRFLVDQIKPYRPKKIILFGSYAWGKPSKASDVDLFVIKDSRKLKHRRITDVERLLGDASFPMDILVYTPAEVRARLKLGDFFVTRVINEGKVLYEKK